ncbi:MAG: class I SAM-dependent methyltransferase [Pyrinomonadaceae bacterium]
MPPILESHQRILDVGCGAGQTLIATNLASGVMAVGVDIDCSALSIGRQMNSRIHLVGARGEALPFQKEHFDFVFSRVALPYMNLHKALGEMWRVLRVGGRIWIALHPFSLVLKEMHESISRLEIKSAIYRSYVIANGITLNLLGKEFAFPFKKEHYECFQTDRGIRRILKRVGFNSVEIAKNNFFVATAIKNAPTMPSDP